MLMTSVTAGLSWSARPPRLGHGDERLAGAAIAGFSFCQVHYRTMCVPGAGAVPDRGPWPAERRRGRARSPGLQGR